MDIKRVVRGTEEYLKYYATACEWWKFWKFTGPPIESLPVNMLLAYDEKGPAGIAFMYQTDSNIAWLEWIVASPEISKESRALAQEMLLSTVKVLASALGFSAIFTSTKNQRLEKRLESKFKKADVGVTHFVWRT